MLLVVASLIDGLLQLLQHAIWVVSASATKLRK